MSAELPPKITADGSLLDKLALDRQKLWEAIGMPQSPKYMTEEIMNREYRGRFSCINRDVLKEAQHALKFVACPRCVVERTHGEITVTRFHISVQDDVMTVFKAMARCFCYNCAMEEFWPLSRDPRAQDEHSAERYQYEREMAMRQKAMQQANNAAQQGAIGLGIGMAGAANSLLGAMGQAPRNSPFSSMRPDEMESLQRMYEMAVNSSAMDPSQKSGVMEAIRKRLGI